MPHPLYALPAVREQRGLSLELLAERAHVSLRTLRRIEGGGKPMYRTWRSVARALRVQPYRLLHGDNLPWATCPDCHVELA